MNHGGNKDEKRESRELPKDMSGGDTSPDSGEKKPAQTGEDATAAPQSLWEAAGLEAPSALEEEPEAPEEPVETVEESPQAQQEPQEPGDQPQELQEKPAKPKRDVLSDGVRAREKVRLEQVEDALAAAEENREIREAGPQTERAGGRKGLSLLFTVLLLVVMAVSIAAGHHFRARQGVAYYVKRLKSEDPGVQNYARDSLSRLGDVAVPSLEKLIEGEDERVALAAVDTLGLIGGTDSIELLMELTTHANANVRKRALSALGEHGAPQAFANVVEQISSDDHETRLCAIAALENESFEARKAVPVLLDLLDDKDWQVRNAAAKVLVGITGQELGTPKSTFTPSMNRIIRDRWHDWWKENGPTFQRPKE